MRTISQAPISFLGLFLAFQLLFITTIQAQTLSVTIPQEGGNTEASTALGFSTGAWKDGDLRARDVEKMAPKMLRWPEGFTGNHIQFNKDNPNVFNVGVHDYEHYNLKTINADTVNWTSTPDLSFDNFVSICKEMGAEPIIIIGIKPIYAKFGEDNMSREAVIQAAVDFVTYANITKGYGIKYWEIGNEDDFSMVHEEGYEVDEAYALYADIFNELVPKLKAVDPSISCGANAMQFVDDEGWNKLLPQVEGNIDFLVPHNYSFFSNEQYDEWYPNEKGWDWVLVVTHAKEAIENNPSAPKSIFVTEISSYRGDEWILGNSNSTWKGLYNIQMQLSALSQPYTKSVIHWTSRWDEEPLQVYNMYTPSYEVTAIGWSVATMSRFMYNNLGPKVTPDEGLTTMWVSHNDELDKMSVYLMNRGESSEIVSVSIDGYQGDYEHQKWVYSGSSPLANDASLVQKEKENISSNSFAITLDPLSVTVLDFGGTFTTSTDPIFEEDTPKLLRQYGSQIESQYPGLLSLSIYDMNGKAIHQNNVLRQGDRIEVNVNTAGIYTAVARFKNQVRSYKFFFK